MMKKLFSMLAFAAMLSACSSGDSVVDIDDKPVTPPAPNTTEVFLGTTRSNQFIPMTTMVEESDYIAQDANVSVYKATKTFTSRTAAERQRVSSTFFRPRTPASMV